MKRYQYHALNIHGQKIKGTIPAKTREQALQNLKTKKLQPIFLKPKRFAWLDKNRSTTWTIEWCKDIGFFLGQGLSLVESLQASKLRLTKMQKQFIDSVLEGLYAGLPLSDILSEHQLFPKLFIGFLKVAESTGQYAEAFSDYAHLKSEEANFFKQLRSNLQYPIFLTVVILGMVIGFNEFLFPIVLDFFKSNNYEQHLFTKAFVGFSEILKTIFSFCTNLPLIIGLTSGFYICLKIPKFKYFISVLSLR